MSHTMESVRSLAVAKVVRVTMQERLVALALATAMALAAWVAAVPAHAARWTPAERSVQGQLVDVQVQVQNRNVPLFASPRGDDRHYFEAFTGQEYAVQLRNTTGQRIGVLVAVDGLNVISGDRSSLSNHESMYVLDPYGTTTIRGWRSSLNDVRRFVFVDEDRSYATRTGQANGDLGWVRVLAFREQRPMMWRDQRYRIDERNVPQPYDGAPQAGLDNEGGASNLAAPAPSAPGARKSALGFSGEARQKDEAQANPGTGWGRGSYDPVHEVDFVAQWQPTDRITLRYEYADGLRALGIEPRHTLDRTWQRDRGELGFAQPPRW